MPSSSDYRLTTWREYACRIGLRAKTDYQTLLVAVVPPDALCAAVFPVAASVAAFPVLNR